MKGMNSTSLGAYEWKIEHLGYTGPRDIQIAATAAYE